MANLYGTVSGLKARLGMTGTADDTVLDAVLDACSRHIEGHCGRRFYASTETRYYSAETPGMLQVDDLLAITTLSSLTANSGGTRTYGTTWAATDYDLWPANAATSGKPYTAIRVNPGGRYAFPGDALGVKIVGSFGFNAGASTAAPTGVIEAAYLMAERLFKRLREAPFGVVGSADLGQVTLVPRLDPDVRMLLGPLVRYTVGVV